MTGCGNWEVGPKKIMGDGRVASNRWEVVGRIGRRWEVDSRN